MISLRFALRQLRRDWRAGELTVLMLALVVAVASVTSVTFFTNRIHQALEGQANDLLGADLVLMTDRPVSKARKQEVTRLGLQLAETVEFPTMVMAGDNSQLVALKAVTEHYPLRGRNRISRQLFAIDEEIEGAPLAGSVWVGSRLLTVLGIDVGDTISIGMSQLKVAAVLASGPDQSEGMVFDVAPRLLMNHADLEATQLIQPGSRAHYRLLLAGDEARIAELRQQWQPQLAPGESMLGVKEARPEVRQALLRGENFLGLAAMVSVLLAGAAVAMAARRFVGRHLDNCAVMRCLGAEQGMISRLYICQMFTLGLLASTVGIVIGYLAQGGLVGLLGPLAGVSLPSPSAWPVVWGLLTGMVTLLGFAIPPILQLKDVPTLRVLRRDMGRVKPKAALTYVMGIGAFFVLVLIYAQDIKLAAAMVGGLGIVLGLLLLLAGALVWGLRRIKPRAGSSWRFGIVNISRRAGSSMVQMMGFAVGMMALLLLTVVRTDLLSEWENRLPADAPNRFLINIQPEQLPQVQRFFESEGLTAPMLYPMVRARLTEINNRPVSAEDYETDRGKRLVQREFNLSWAASLPEDNEVTAGQWWSEDEQGQALLSVEEGLAKTLKLGIGDMLTYNMAGEVFTAKITSLRKVKWDSFRANFFVITPPGTMENYPATYITGFYLAEADHDVLNRLVQQFPNITVLDVAAILKQVRSIIERVTLAVEYVFIFTILAGLMVMYAAIHSTLDERIREAAIMRTLGARRGQLLSNIVLEYAGLGMLSGLVAAIAAGAVGMVIAERVFELIYVPGPELWLSGMLIGAMGIGLAGTLGTRFVVNQPPLRTLQGV